MNLKKAFRKLVPLWWQRTRKDELLSMVMLLREPHLFGADELRLEAQRAWRASFAGGGGSMNCIEQSDKVTFLKAGPRILSLFCYPAHHIETPKENIEWLPQPNQRQAWSQHSACVGVDYLNDSVEVEPGYAVLALLVSEMLDGNCTGIYIPRENRLIPHNESLYLELQKLASPRDFGIPPGSSSG
jgi:hypothetical protein